LILGWIIAGFVAFGFGASDWHFDVMMTTLAACNFQFLTRVAFPTR
jgi:hypothetical protein